MTRFNFFLFQRDVNIESTPILLLEICEHLTASEWKPLFTRGDFIGKIGKSIDYLEGEYRFVSRSCLI